MQNIKEFLEEYKSWSSQEKFKDFGFIQKLSPKWEQRLLSRKKFNLWAMLFGPLYYLYLRMYGWSFLYIPIWLIMISVWTGLVGGIAYFIFVLFLGFMANMNYFSKLKRTRKNYKDFNPDADTTYFNISSARLFVCSIMTGGFYLIYWAYRNYKAIRNDQKDDIWPIVNAIFIPLTSINIFRSVAHSAKLVSYPRKTRPRLAAILFFLFYLSPPSCNFEINAPLEGENATVGELLVSLPQGQIDFMTKMILILLITMLTFLILRTLVIASCQDVIHYYSQERKVPVVSTFTGWEIAIIVLSALFFITSIVDAFTSLMFLSSI